MVLKEFSRTLQRVHFIECRHALPPRPRCGGRPHCRLRRKRRAVGTDSIRPPSGPATSLRVSTTWKTSLALNRPKGVSSCYWLLIERDNFHSSLKKRALYCPDISANPAVNRSCASVNGVYLRVNCVYQRGLVVDNEAKVEFLGLSGWFYYHPCFGGVRF